MKAKTVNYRGRLERFGIGLYHTRQKKKKITEQEEDLGMHVKQEFGKWKATGYNGKDVDMELETVNRYEVSPKKATKYATLNELMDAGALRIDRNAFEAHLAENEIKAKPKDYLVKSGSYQRIEITRCEG